MLKRLKKWTIPLVLAVVSCAKTEPTEFVVGTPGMPSALTKTLTVSVTCDFTWNAQLADPSWGSLQLVKSETGGNVHVIMGINTHPEDRKNTLIITSGSQEYRREILQRGTTYLFGTDEIHLSGTQAQILNFDSPIPWRARFSDGANWMEPLTQLSGEGRVSLSLAAQEDCYLPSDRTACLEFTFDGTSVVPLSIRQDHVTVPGAYGVNGADYIYGAKAFPQLSRMYSTNGEFLTRLLNPESGTMVEISGFTLPSATGDAVQVSMVIRQEGMLTYTLKADGKILGVNDGMMWVQASSARFVIKI